MKKICVDLDGTLVSYSKGWLSEEVFGDPVPGAKEALQALKDDGWTIIVFTTRGNRALVKQHLESNGLLFDHINEDPAPAPNTNPGKPQCEILVDDQAIRFDGDWAKTLEKIRRFRRWEEKDPAVPADEDERGYSFLEQDFEQAQEQLRFYDSRQWSVFRFFFSSLFVVVGASWTLFSYGLDKSIDFSWVVVILMALSGSMGLFVCIMLARNRLYFTVTARYINAHRDFFLSKRPGGFQNPSGYYTDYRKPEYFYGASLHTRMIRYIAILDSLLLGAAGFILVAAQWARAGIQGAGPIVIATIVAVVVSGLSYWLHTVWVWRDLKALAEAEKERGKAISANRAILGSGD